MVIEFFACSGPMVEVCEVGGAGARKLTVQHVPRYVSPLCLLVALPITDNMDVAVQEKRFEQRWEPWGASGGASVSGK